MAKVHSSDLKEQVLRDCDAGIRSEDVVKNTLSRIGSTHIIVLCQYLIRKGSTCGIVA